MFKIECITKEKIKLHNPNWSQFPDHPYRMLIIGDSRLGKTNVLLYVKAMGFEPTIT